MRKNEFNIENMLSVIIPVYNTEKYINKCLKSIITQTYTNLEIIIIDDGSTDSSLSICKELEKEDPRVVVISNKNKGVSSTRNCGIKKARGEYITFVDSDDYLELDTYEKALANMGDADAVFFGYFEEYDNPIYKRVISPLRSGKTESYNAIYNCVIPDGNNYFTSVCNKVFRREKVKEIFFNEAYAIGEDEVWLYESILKLSSIVLYNEPLYHYVQRFDSTIHSFRKIAGNWRNHVAAKERAIQLVSNNKKCYDSVSAKEFSDLFNFVVYTYAEHGYTESYKVYNKIKRFKKNFLLSKGFNFRRKIKVILVLFLIMLRAPKRLITSIWEITTFKIKLKMFKRS